MIAKDVCPMLFDAKENKVEMDRSQCGLQNAEIQFKKLGLVRHFRNVFEKRLLCSLRLCLYVQKYSKNSQYCEIICKLLFKYYVSILYWHQQVF